MIGGTMKSFIIIALCFSMVFYAAASFSESDEICCTWFNMKHTEGKFPQKIMFHYDGTYATYNKINSSKASARGMFQITKKWTDSEGYIWYKIIMNDPKQGKKYKLAKVSQNGRRLEFVCNKNIYPSELNANESGYCNYLRASMDFESLP